MRANRSVVWDEEAVSPVIAVILMVAITVVLAATVFVLVSDIGKQTGSAAPSFQMTKDEANDKLTVTSRGEGANWNRIELRGNNAWTFELNNVAVAGPEIAGGDWQAVATSSDPIEAGDIIDVCDSFPGQTTQLTLDIRDLQTQSLLHTINFDSIDGTC